MVTMVTSLALCRCYGILFYIVSVTTQNFSAGLYS